MNSQLSKVRFFYLFYTSYSWINAFVNLSIDNSLYLSNNVLCAMRRTCFYCIFIALSPFMYWIILCPPTPRLLLLITYCGIYYTGWTSYCHWSICRIARRNEVAVFIGSVDWSTNCKLNFVCKFIFILIRTLTFALFFKPWKTNFRSIFLCEILLHFTYSFS